MYAFHRLFLEPGERQVFAVPSWNNGYYGQLCGAESVAIHTSPGDDFFPDPDELARHLVGARVFNLNSPLNPTGTVISADRLAAIARVVVAENQRRIGTGERPLMWMWDQVYWQLCLPPTVSPGRTPRWKAVLVTSQRSARRPMRPR
jgi:aspartate aminotransferase